MFSSSEFKLIPMAPLGSWPASKLYVRAICCPNWPANLAALPLAARLCCDWRPQSVIARSSLGAAALPAHSAPPVAWRAWPAWRHLAAARAFARLPIKWAAAGAGGGGRARVARYYFSNSSAHLKEAEQGGPSGWPTWRPPDDPICPPLAPQSPSKLLDPSALI